MTGAPMPSDAMSRMQMAPEVYKFTKNFGRKPNILEKTGNLIKSAGRNTLVGAGLLAGMDLENQERQKQESLRNEIAKDDAVEATISESPEQVTSEPMTAGERQIDKKMKMLERQAELEQQARDDKQAKAKELLSIKANNLKQGTSADSYGQDVVENQTEEGILDKKMEQGSEIATEGDTVAKVLSESQDSQPSNTIQNIETEIKGYTTPEEEMIGASATAKKVSEFLSQKGLEPLLIAAIGEREQEEKFSDHPDIIGGEDDSNLPGSQNMVVNGMSTSSTTDLSAHHKEMRKMDAMERNKEAIDEIVEQAPTPSEKQVGSSPNVLAGKDQATFLALTGTPSQQRKIEADQAKSRVEQKTAAKQRMSGMKTPLTEKYYPSDVARTDIQVGGMVDRKTGLGKSVGISYTPMNGDTKVGFNIMNDPTKPTEVGTFDFVAPPETMQSLQSQKEEDLGSKTFGKLFNMARQKKQGFSSLEM
jgi:hypothetical protein